jgi:NCS2 family nucleobase:cation symporter-2
MNPMPPSPSDSTSPSNAPVKPENILYGVEERPPLFITLQLALQHVAVISAAFLLAAVFARQAGVTEAEVGIVVSLAMLTMGVAAILQALPRGPVGSRLLCPALCGPAYLGASLLAIQSGGLAFISGMMFIVGIFELCASRFLIRLRALFPVEVIGVVVLMVGLEVIVFSIPRFFGFTAGHGSPDGRSLVVALITLAAMVIPAAWSKGRLRLYALLIGVLIGYAAAHFAGVIPAESLDHLRAAPWVDVPRVCHFGWGFDVALIVPFLIAALSSTLKGVGDFATAQRISDANWKQPDMAVAGRGVFALGLSNLFTALVGGLGLSTSSSNVGLSLSTGAISRVILYFFGGLMVLLAFLPKVAAVYVLMPEPVLGAAIIFVQSFMIVAGIQLIRIGITDTRKTLAIGLALAFSLSVDTMPWLYKGLPGWLAPFFANSLSLATILAVTLSLVLRIGERSAPSKT